MHKDTLDLTLVIDIGKSNAKLLLIDATGTVVERHSRANASVPSPLGYTALDVHGLQAWMQATLRASRNAQRCGHAIASTHGAALVALGEDALAWEPLDYEYQGVALQGAAAAAFSAAHSFRETLSPNLPAGLNAARQLHWLQNTQPEAWRGTQSLMPYAQYWAWLLCGVRSSEVSSLGCHTHLWNPTEARYSSLAVARGWAELFAPLRQAWEVLGTLGQARAAAWGLSAHCQVHVGVHDSNACLARYLQQGTQDQALTLVSSGTWTVLMAPGAAAAALDPAQDMLGNVDVSGRMTPTARFMGGREFAALLDGADPACASAEAVQTLLDSHTLAIPSFAPQGGPFAGCTGHVQRGGQIVKGALSLHLPPAERAALAALYCAQLTAWLTLHLWQGSGQAAGRVVVEGPLAGNPVYLQLLQALLPQHLCQASADDLEGTARGAWMLARWGQASGGLILTQAEPLAEPLELRGLAAYQQQWLQALPARA